MSMLLHSQLFKENGMQYTIRSAERHDAKMLSEARVQIDGETENMDREAGEAYISASEFEEIIAEDSEHPRNLFLVAVVDDQVVGFSRCAGGDLKRCAHKVEFGVCVLKDYWGHRIGKHLMEQSIAWADANGISKIALNVLETNKTAIRLYQKLGFEIEGVLKKDKRLSDGQYYDTIAMARFNGI